MKIKIGKKSSIVDIEKWISEGLNHQGEIEVWLAGRGKNFFTNARIAALFFTLQSKGLRVVNWGSKDPKDFSRFEHTVEGLAALACAKEVKTASGEICETDFVKTILELSSKSGIPERYDRVGFSRKFSSLSFCAYDDLLPRLLGLPSIDGDKDEWVRELISRRGKFFPEILASDVSDELSVGRFIFELFQNTAQHGKLDKFGGILKGLRSISLEKHISTNASELSERASGFVDLSKYLTQYTKRLKSNTAKFFEVSISDSGIGIIGQYKAARERRKQGGLNCSDSQFINMMMERSLSSKDDNPGAGQGLARSLRFVHNLGGFVSLRTDNVWLYYSALQNDFSFQKVSMEGPLPNIRGTHFSLIYPMR